MAHALLLCSKLNEFVRTFNIRGTIVQGSGGGGRTRQAFRLKAYFVVFDAWQRQLQAAWPVRLKRGGSQEELAAIQSVSDFKPKNGFMVVSKQVSMETLCGL
jgi:hypothetical protein